MDPIRGDYQYGRQNSKIYSISLFYFFVDSFLLFTCILKIQAEWPQVLPYLTRPGEEQRLLYRHNISEMSDRFKALIRSKPHSAPEKEARQP